MSTTAKSDSPDNAEEDEPDDERPGPMARAWPWLIRCGVLAVFVAAALILFNPIPERVPLGDDPGFLDIVFASRLTVGATRILLIFACIYAAMSIVVLAVNGRWITTFAGVHTSKIERSVSGLEEERQRLANELEESRETIQQLEIELEAALDELERLTT